MPQAADNPCVRCGACCAGFRVDFAAQELDTQGGTVPESLAVQLTATLCRMRGTDHACPRQAWLAAADPLGRSWTRAGP
jgi:uncharacterized protein